VDILDALNFGVSSFGEANFKPLFQEADRTGASKLEIVDVAHIVDNLRETSFISQIYTKAARSTGGTLTIESLLAFLRKNNAVSTVPPGERDNHSRSSLEPDDDRGGLFGFG
jgi:hypothetical protein